MLIMQISNQTGNHKYRKVLQPKQVLLKKWVWSFETLSSKFYAKNISFLKIETIWSSEVNKAIPEQVKVVVNVVVLDYDYVKLWICFNFLTL